MISHNLRCILIHIPKTGGSSITRVLDPTVQVGGDGRQFGYDEGSMAQTNVYLEDKHVSATYLKQKYPHIFDKYFKFALVRNPWSHIVAQYEWHTFIKTFTGRFDQYVSIYRLYQYSMLDQLTVNGHLAVDYIGRFEQLQESFDYVCEQLGISKQMLPHLNLNPKKKYSHYTDYYTDNTRRLVELMHRRDIIQFGYKFGE